MAKLSAHGFEVARLVCETNVTNPDRSTDRERATYSFRSDGYVLIKHDVHFRERGEWHSYGWKLHRKLSDRKRDTVARMKKLAVSIHDRALSGANARDAAEVYFTTAPIL